MAALPTICGFFPSLAASPISSKRSSHWVFCLLSWFPTIPKNGMSAAFSLDRIFIVSRRSSRVGFLESKRSPACTTASTCISTASFTTSSKAAKKSFLRTSL